jgi:hypothetical protein
VDEIVRLVGAALAGGTADCAAGDVDQSQTISVDEIVTALSVALLGCEAPVVGPDLTTRFPRPRLAVGMLPGALAVADVDGDDLLDIITLNIRNSSLSILFQKESGGFQPQRVVSVGNDATSLRVAALGPDQRPALLVADSSSGSLLVTTYDEGAFSTASFPAGEFPGALAVTDFDGDSLIDVVVANRAAERVTVLLSAEAGGFATAMPFEVGGPPGLLTAGDVDGDRVTDVLVPLGTTQLAILRGIGNGALASPVVIDVGAAANVVEIADLNGDRMNDLVVQVESVGSDGVAAVALVASGDGTFDLTHELRSDRPSFALTVADVDGDGAEDVISGGADAVSLFVGRGDGTFLDEVVLRTDATVLAVEVADVNTDGKLDILYAAFIDGEVSVFWGVSGREFAVERSFPSRGSISAKLLSVDVEGDGRADLATLNLGSDDISILSNRGNGTFAEPRVIDVPSQVRAMAFGDFDHDRFPDLAAGYDSSTCQACIAAFRGIGDGRFDAPMTFSTIPRILSLAAARLDGDMIDDVVSLSSTGVSVLGGLGGLMFTPAETFAAGAEPQAMVVTDLNGDGFDDVATANAESFAVLLANGSGSLLPAAIMPSAIELAYIEAADINGDGMTDLAVGGLGRLGVSFGLGEGAFSNLREIASVGAGGPFELADVNGDGRFDLVALTDGLTIHPGVFAGVFASPQHFGFHALAADLLVRDLNSDGAVDVATANAELNGSVSVVLGAAR